MNHVQLIGRLTRDIELKQSPSGISVVRFTLAVNRSFKNNQGEYDADFINCIAYRQTADLMAKYFQKGSQLALSGRIQTGSYDNQQGQRVYTTDVVVNQIYFVGSSQQGSTSQRSNSQQNGGNFAPNGQNHMNTPLNSNNANLGGYDAFEVPSFVSDDDLPF